jgi:hypothetical protein
LFVSAILASATLLGAAASPAFALPERFFGMTAHETMNDSEPDWNALQRAGVQRFRMQIKWQTINAAGGGGEKGWTNEWAWQNTYDRYFEKAAKRDIEILPHIFTRKGGSQQYFWTGEPGFQEWKEFVWTVVQRYGDAGTFWKNHLGLPQYPVHYWEVWNEPNLKVNCPGEWCNGREYGEFLVATSKTIHEAQSAIYADTAKVLFGGLYQERWNYPITSYLQAAGLAPGIKTAYDGLSLHPYAFGKEGEKDAKGNLILRNNSEKAAGISANVNEAYDAQNNGIGVSKPIWVTEFGWPVDGTGAQHVTPSDQAWLLGESYNWLKQASASIYNVKYAAWYFYKDVSSDPNTKWDQHAGLRAYKGAFRPAWYAYQNQAGKSPWPGGQMALQANTNQLFVYSTGTGPGNTGFGMAANTSPSVATLDDGEWVTAFQSNGNQLWIRLGSTEYGNTGFGMASGTSPSITGLPNGEWVAAFQSNGNQLWVRRSNTEYGNTGFGMASGTSPSITVLPNGEWVAAFQSNGNQLWVRRSNTEFENTGFAMAPGTSPSITVLPNGEWVAAFQSNGNQLWTRSSSGAYENTGLSMAAGTSPSISPPSRWSN